MLTTNDSLHLIGKTPVYRIKDSHVYVKLEKYNVGGSVKDRAVLGMLKAAQAQGVIKEDTILVEATSGNTGIALAMLAAIYGLKAVIIMPESMSRERRELIKAYGAQLILTPKELGMKGALAKAQEILDTHKEAISLSQFDNSANPAYHYETTGEEILEQVPQVGAVVAGIGTGGTFTGVLRKIKEHKADVVGIAVEPSQSPVLSGGEPGVHKIQGIGAGFVPDNLDRDLVDEITTISDEEAFAQVETFMRESGISIGISAGAAIAVAKQYAAQHPETAVVAIAPDGVEKYLSMLTFSDVTYIEA